MLEYFTEGFQTLSAGIAEISVPVADGLIFALFVVFLFLKNKKPYFPLALAVTAAECAVLCGAERVAEAGLYVALSLAEGCLLTGILSFKKPEKTERYDAPVKEYVRSLTKKLETPVIEHREKKEEGKFASDADVKKSLSLAHARSVIERLHYFDLSAPDRNKLSELEYSLSAMERSDVPLAAINEKLSALIKMLAKYGA